jgi:ribosomal protein S12 methylthiotransferase accessory factor
MRPLVEIVGSGRVGRALLARLPALLPEARFEGAAAPVSGGLAVVVTRLDRSIDAWLRQPGERLTVGLWRGLLYLGPFRAAGPGCFACLVSRLAGSAHGPDVDGKGDVLPAAPGIDPPCSPRALDALCRLIAVELGARLRGEEPRTRSAVLTLDDERGELDLGSLLPDSGCPLCGPAPSRRAPDWASDDGPRCDRRLRTSDALAVMSAVEDRYLGPRFGLVREVQVDLQSPYGTCYLELPLKGKRAEPCIGRSSSYARARAVALLESLERYCGWRRGGPRQVITATHADLAGRAVDPSTLGLHPDDCYRLPGYPFVPYDPHQAIDWVWGHSFRRDEPVLVPARHAFYGHPPDRPTFAYEVSNGCALGANLEEATLHGLLELVERDSFLLTWYRRLALPEITTGDVPDRTVRDLLRRAELVTGASIRVFLSTREHGIPSLFAVASAHDPDGPRTLAAAAAHPDLTQALHGVLHELAGLTLRMQSILRERRAEALPMLEDARLVRKMEDHALVNCLPEARQRFSFLLDGPPPLTFAEALERSGPPLPRSTEVGRALRALVGRILDAGLDVVVVDQTMSELGPAGVRCAKVIVPGFLSMTFGHAHRRTAGLPRLHAPDPLATARPEEVGLVPHPLP